MAMLEEGGDSARTFTQASLTSLVTFVAGILKKETKRKEGKKKKKIQKKKKNERKKIEIFENFIDLMKTKGCQVDVHLIQTIQERLTEFVDKDVNSSKNSLVQAVSDILYLILYLLFIFFIFFVY